jgi:SAM-dependent methyltransferase
MTPEGMVHALEEIHRLLKPGGNLIDIHPVAEEPLIEVYQGGRILLAQPYPDYSAEDCLQADNALAQAVQRGKFVIERSGQFDFLVYGSSVTELLDYVAEANAFADKSKDSAVSLLETELIARVEGIMQTAGEGAEVATHERIHIARLSPVK